MASYNNERDVGFGILQQAVERGIIDISTIQTQVEDMERKDLLQKHNKSIWQGKDGLWNTYLPDENSKTGRKLIRKTTKDMVEEEVVKFYKQKVENPSFEECFNVWIDRKMRLGEISNGTYDRYINDYKRFFKGTELSKTRIKYITEDDLEEFIKLSIKEKKLSAKSYGNLRLVILGVFKCYKRSVGFSISTFFKDLEISSKMFTKREKKTQIFTDEEVAMLQSYLWRNPCTENLGILLAFCTGLRTAELVGLKKCDVDMDKGIISVHRQQIRYKDRENDGKVIHEMVEYTKTEAGERSIILPIGAYRILKKLLSLNPENEYLFVKNNKPLLNGRFNDFLKKACVACGIEVRSMHKIRKTYATTLIDGDVDDSTIMAQMGHSDITTTRKYYYFSNKGHKDKIDQINKALSNF